MDLSHMHDAIPHVLKHLLAHSVYVIDSEDCLLYAPNRLLVGLELQQHTYSTTQLESMLIAPHELHHIQSARKSCHTSSEVITTQCRAHPNLKHQGPLVLHMVRLAQSLTIDDHIILCVIDTYPQMQRTTDQYPFIQDPQKRWHGITPQQCSHHGFIQQSQHIKMTCTSMGDLTPNQDGASDSLEALKQKLEQLEKDNALILKKCEMKNHLLNELSHELRTPLSAIKGFCELMLEGRMGPLPTKQRQYLQQIEENSTHMLELVNQTLGFSKAIRRPKNSEPQAICLQTFLHEVKLGLEPLLQKKAIQLHIASYKPIPFLRLNPLKMRQILYNILQNAIKYSPEHSTIVIAHHWQDGTLQLAIQDRGYGLTKDTQKQLFASFASVPPQTHLHETSLDSITQHNEAGVGLGLYLSRLLIVAMHGCIAIHSDGIDQGTTVHIRFSQVPIASQDDLAHKTTTSHETST